MMKNQRLESDTEPSDISPVDDLIPAKSANAKTAIDEITHTETLIDKHSIPQPSLVCALEPY